MAHFGWTWDYLLWGVRWPIVERMLSDAPGYESGAEETEKPKEKPKPLDDQAAAEIMAKLSLS